MKLENCSCNCKCKSKKEPTPVIPNKMPMFLNPHLAYETVRRPVTRPQSKADLNRKLPWLPERAYDDNTPIEMSVFGQKLLLPSENPSALDKRAVLKAFADAFPSYLPRRYHSMDSDAIRRNSENWDYWESALYFTKVSINYGTKPYYNLLTRKPNEDKPLFHFYPELGGRELCESAAEFLLEPWVLLQLPFQPALLHQWAVAAYAESIKFTARLDELTNKGHAPDLADLMKKLEDVDNALSSNCETFIAHFFMIYCKAPEESIHIKAKKMLDQKFSEQLAETLAALEFIMSDSCTDVLNFIKRTSWSKKYSPLDLKYFVLCDLSLEELSKLPNQKRSDLYSVYTPSHWNQEAMFRLCEPARQRSGIEKLKSDRDWKWITGEVNDAYLSPGFLEPFMESFKTFAFEKVLKGGPLKGIEDPDMLIKMIQQSLSQKTQYQLTVALPGAYRDVCELASGSPASPAGGVIQQILSLQYDSSLHNARNSMTRMIWTAAAKSNENVFLDASEIPVQEGLTKEVCISNLHEFLARKELWTTQNIFKKVELSFNDVSNGSLPDNFTFRIRRLVLKMYQKQYATCKEGPFHFYPECFLVQYLLPCFVALYLEAQEDTSLSTELKCDFQLFVHELIKSYEQQEYVQLIGRAKKRNFHSGLHPVLQIVNDTLYSKLKISENLFNNLDQFMLSLNLLSSNFPVPKLKITFVDSDFPLYTLFRRMEVCLMKVGWIRSREFMNHNVIPIFSQIKNKLSGVDNVLQLHIAEMNFMITDIHFKKSLLADLENLFSRQLFSITLFHVMNIRMNQEKFNSIFQAPLFPLDPCPQIVSKILSRDWWALREMFTPYLGRPGDALIPWELAKTASCCRSLINALGSDKKVKMATPGEITFFPIQHCRWCGLVNARHFQLCKECKDEPEFPLPNYFCSQGCEEKAMDACHSEENARFVMMKLGIWE